MSRRVRSMLLLGAAAAVMFGVFTLSVGSSSASSSPVFWPSGVFAGYGPGGDAAFGAWRGAPVGVATDYIGSDDWGQIEDPVWAISHWGAAGVVPDLTVALWPASGGSLSEAASGAYDSHFVALARNLVAGGLGSVGVRLGWEFNGTWYPWSVSTPVQAGEYAAAWRQIVGAMRSVPGANFTFVWCPNLQAIGLDPGLAYPGDAYVSVVGMDVYDWNESSANESASRRWSDIVNKGWGLAWQAAFAAAHDKPIGFPEWALVSYPAAPAGAGGDDPTFIQNMFNWFKTHDTAFENYFNVDAPSLGTFYGLTTGNGYFPKASALYQGLYSGQLTASFSPTVSAAPAITPVKITLRFGRPAKTHRPRRVAGIVRSPGHHARRVAGIVRSPGHHARRVAGIVRTRGHHRSHRPEGVRSLVARILPAIELLGEATSSFTL